MLKAAASCAEGCVLKRAHTHLQKVAYLAKEERISALASELQGRISTQHGALILASRGEVEPIFSLNKWKDPILVHVSSIADAARALKEASPHLYAYNPRAGGLFRRSQLIETEYLDSIRRRSPPRQPGAWTLLEKDKVLISTECSSPFPNGDPGFRETMEPPSRAYLKLWEALTLAGVRPTPGERCLDLGSSPGAWTWALQRLGAHVISVDKAPLAPEVVARLPNIKFVGESAFGLSPQSIGRVDWLFSDIACYPERLWSLVDRWLRSGLCKNYVCTVKLQGTLDLSVFEPFRKVPGSRLVHLFHNKNEVTWMLTPGREGQLPLSDKR